MGIVRYKFITSPIKLSNEYVTIPGCDGASATCIASPNAENTPSNKIWSYSWYRVITYDAAGNKGTLPPSAIKRLLVQKK